MKKVIFILLAILIMVGVAQARVDRCDWIWSTAVTDVNDPPDYVYCSLDGAAFVSMGATYIMNSQGAKGLTYTYDTTSTGAATSHGVTICSNTATPDINFLTCLDGSCSTGTTTVAYYQIDSIADAIVNGGELTPPSNFKPTVDENASANACVLLKTEVYW